MNKKLKLRLVLVIVACIWGYNIYRVYNNYEAEQELAEIDATHSEISFSPTMFNKDSFDLLLPDVDPFLKTQSRSISFSTPEDSENHNSTNQHNRNITKKKDMPKNIPWPTIKYLGFVKNLGSDDALCLIQINGAMVKVSEGDQEMSVFVSNVFRDSIHLVYAGEERTFRKG